MKTFAKAGPSSSTKLTSALSVPSAVFVFDQTTGEAMSMNGAAIKLLSRFKLGHADRLSLAVVERAVMADAHTTCDPAVTEGLMGEAAELRRVARQPDGSVLAVSRVWAPGMNAMLVVEDITAAAQDARRQRVWDMLAPRMEKSDNFAEALSRALQVFCRLTASSCGEVWLSDAKGLMRRSMHLSAQAASKASATASRLKSPDQSAVGRAWSSETPHRVGKQAAIPVHAGGVLVAVLAFDISSGALSGPMALSLIESLVPMFGLTLVNLRARDFSRATAAGLGNDAEDVGVARRKPRAKASNQSTEMRVAG